MYVYVHLSNVYILYIFVCIVDVREVCCLPGAQVRDVARKLPGLVQPSDYYPLSVMQVGGDEITKRTPKAIKRDFRALGRQVEDQGHRWSFLQSHQWQGRALKGAGKLT